MTRTSSPRASSRSARCEPMKPAPPVIRHSHASDLVPQFAGAGSVNSRCAVVERLLPELEARAAPRACARTRCSRLEPGEHLAVVDQCSRRARVATRDTSSTKSRAASGWHHSCSGTGKPILSLRSTIDRRAARRRRDASSTCFSVAVLELHVRRHRGRELDERVVEERHARLEPVRHAHAVLDLQQRRQQRLEVEVRHLVEVRLLADVARRGRSRGTSRTASSRRAASQSISSSRCGARLIRRK